ncbi:hypothetical protein Bbelb_151410, partial [Branchiostoma belcheri]
MAATTGSVRATGDSVPEIFESMDYGPAPESPDVVRAWLDKYDRSFGHFINGKWVKPEGRKTYQTKCPATGEVLATTIQGEDEDVELAVGAARKAFESWSTLPCHVRARYLYSIARNVQKHQRILTVMESLDNGKPFRESRDADVPLVVRHFYHHAGWAQLMDTEMQGWKPIGVVGAIVPWNFPLMLLTWKVCPALAMGNTVVLKPATYTRMSALMLAEICAEAGLPPGVFNVVTGNGRFGSKLACHPDVDKVGFTGSTEVGQLLRRAVAGTGKKLSLELGGKSPIVVFDSADLDSAVEGVVDAIWFNQGQVCSAGSRLLVQESVFNPFITKLKSRMNHLRVGDSLDKCIDMGALVDESQMKTIKEYVEEARKEGAEVHQVSASFPKHDKGFFYPPTLITNVQTVSRVVREEIFGPVLVALPFRTAKEAIALGNNTNYGLGASVWTESIPLGLEAAVSLKAGAVWVNCHNMFDAAAGFGGYKESGYGRDGGKESINPCFFSPMTSDVFWHVQNLLWKISLEAEVFTEAVVTKNSTAVVYPRPGPFRTDDWPMPVTRRWPPKRVLRLPPWHPTRALLDFAPEQAGWRRPRGAPRTRWMDVVQRDLSNINIQPSQTQQLAEDRGKWRALTKLGLYEYAKPAWQDRPRPNCGEINYTTFAAKYGATVPPMPGSGTVGDKSLTSDGAIVPGIDRTYKLYYGGGQKRPDGQYSRPVIGQEGRVLALVGEANRKDVRNAVEAAHKAAPG